MICIGIYNTNGNFVARTYYYGYSLPNVTPLGISDAGLASEALYLDHSIYPVEDIGQIDNYPEGGRTSCQFSTLHIITRVLAFISNRTSSLLWRGW